MYTIVAGREFSRITSFPGNIFLLPLDVMLRAKGTMLEVFTEKLTSLGKDALFNERFLEKSIK